MTTLSCIGQYRMARLKNNHYNHEHYSLDLQFRAIQITEMIQFSIISGMGWPQLLEFPFPIGLKQVLAHDTKPVCFLSF